VCTIAINDITKYRIFDVSTGRAALAEMKIRISNL
jgi:hypothetical protein